MQAADQGPPGRSRMEQVLAELRLLKGSEHFASQTLNSLWTEIYPDRGDRPKSAAACNAQEFGLILRAKAQI